MQVKKMHALVNVIATSFLSLILGSFGTRNELVNTYLVTFQQRKEV
jgi:hypothetical protein